MKRFLLALSLLAATVAVPPAPAGPRHEIGEAGEHVLEGQPVTGEARAGGPKGKGPAGRKSSAPKKKEGSKKRQPSKETSTKGAGTKKGTAAKKAPAAPKFSWPVASRRILTPYGERRNPQTRTVTLNPGINIAAKKGSGVTAAASGTISMISWLPSFGTFVIVEHRDGWRTVYANLASTLLSKGAAVRAGTRLGTVGSTSTGTYLHFQVWKRETRLDPLSLLQ